MHGPRTIRDRSHRFESVRPDTFGDDAVDESTARAENMASTVRRAHCLNAKLELM